MVRDNRFQAAEESLTKEKTTEDEASDTESETESETKSETQSETTSDAGGGINSPIAGGEEGDGPVREKKHIGLYIDEDLADALDARFDELQNLYQKQHSGRIEKNRDYYPALFEAAFRRDADVLDVLEVKRE
jgi:hypothetical protein